MLQYTVTPKRSALMKARIRDESPAFVFEVPADDAELAAKVGNDAEGAPKLTLTALGQEAIARAVQVQLSKRLAASAERVGPESDADFKPEQFVSDEELAAMIADSYDDAYRLLIGERASSGGRLSEKAKYEAKEAARVAEQVEAIRTQFTAATGKAMRQMIVTMAQQFGFADLATELSAQL